MSSDPSSDGVVLTDEQQETLEEAFEQVKYFIEDLDHANGYYYNDIILLLL